MIGEVISKVIGKNTEVLGRIRPDLNIEKWTMWQPAKSKNPSSVRVFEREITLDGGDKLIAHVEIGFTQHGTFTTEDQKTYYALVRCWEKERYSLDSTPLGLRELARCLKTKWGTGVKDSLTKSLWRLRFTPITWRNSYYNKATKKTIRELNGFNILSDLKIVETETDGAVNQIEGFFQFHERILSSLSSNYTKPLIFDVAIGFKSEIAQLLYTHLELVMADKTHYERRTEGLFDDLGLKGESYKYRGKRKARLEPALEELQGKPLSTGVLISATIEKTRDGKDYKVVFKKKVKRNLRKKIRGTQATQVQNEQDSTGLAGELYERGIKPKRVAIELCENHDEDYIREKIDMFDFHLKADGGTISDNPAGWLRVAIERDIKPTQKQLKAGKDAIRQKVEEQVRELELEKGKIKKPYDENCRQIFERLVVENKKVVDEAMQAALKENPILVDFYDESKPFAEQSGWAQAMTKPKLREKFPDMFQSIDNDYKKKIEEINKQITDLKMPVQ